MNQRKHIVRNGTKASWKKTEEEEEEEDATSTSTTILVVISKPVHIVANEGKEEAGCCCCFTRSSIRLLTQRSLLSSILSGAVASGTDTEGCVGVHIKPGIGGLASKGGGGLRLTVIGTSVPDH